MARAFPASLEVDGAGTPEGEVDWYRLPAVAAGETLVLRYGGAVSGLHLGDGTADIAATDDPGSGHAHERAAGLGCPALPFGGGHGRLPPGVVITHPGRVAPPGELPVTLSVVPDTAAVSAYEQVGQRVPATIEVANAGTEPRRRWRSMPAPATTAGRWRSTRRT